MRKLDNIVAVRTVGGRASDSVYSHVRKSITSGSAVAHKILMEVDAAIIGHVSIISGTVLNVYWEVDSNANNMV